MPAKGGRRPKDKGNRRERLIALQCNAAGCPAQRVPSSGAAGGQFVGDIHVLIRGRQRVWEVKSRRDGFKFLYSALASHDALVVIADRCEPLIVQRLTSYLEEAQ
jgi:Holliday junction resolvase